MKVWMCSLLAAAAAAVAFPAGAQKSAETVRLAINNPFAMLSPYHLPVDEAGIFYRTVYQSLLGYDEHTHTWVPQLAKSWTRISPTILEFELRDDVTFHNGNKFDADDVIATVEHIVDPKVPMRYKNRYDWMRRVEKLGPHKIRIHEAEPNAIDLGLLAYRFSVQDAETMKGLENVAEYGRVAPHGTGVYKVAQLDKNKGIIVERFDGYKGDAKYGRAPVKRVHGVFVPDRQTQVAELLTGGIDIMGNVIPDQAADLATKPGIEISNTPGGAFVYWALDASGQAGNKALADVRVRRALFMGIDRAKIAKHIVPGGGIAIPLDVPCFESTIACKYSKKPPAYDPEGAKKLLAEAGYPDGFDMTYDIYAPIRDIGVAISGELLRIGVRVKVTPQPIEVYRKRQGDGVLESWSVFYPLGNHPDASSSLAVWFEGKRATYFNNDPIVLKAQTDGMKELDPAKRDDIYKTAFDRINEMSYVLPVASMPQTFAHSKDVKLFDNPLSATERYVGDFGFK